jgi:hypothetical protein
MEVKQALGWDTYMAVFFFVLQARDMRLSEVDEMEIAWHCFFLLSLRLALASSRVSGPRSRFGLINIVPNTWLHCGMT